MNSWSLYCIRHSLYFTVKNELNDLYRTSIVQMILDKRTEEALLTISKFYGIKAPEIVVGTVKGKRRTVYAVYVQKESRIYCINSDVLYNPFIIIHEFYHHLRTVAGVHKGSEKHANQYAKEFIASYNKVMNQIFQSNSHKQ
jgi:hypothetical protein